MCSCGGPSLGSSQDVVCDLHGEGEILLEGIPGVRVVTASHTKDEVDPGEDRPSVCSKFLCESGMLCFFASQSILKTGVSAESDLNDLKGSDGAEVTSPGGVGSVQQGGVIFHKKDVGAKSVPLCCGEFGEHPLWYAVAYICGECFAPFTGIHKEMCIGRGRVRGLTDLPSNHVHSFIMPFHPESCDLGMFAFPNHVSCRVETFTQGAIGRGRGPGSLVMNAASKFCVPECSIPEFHDGPSLRGWYVGFVNVSLCVWYEVFFRCCPSVLVDAFDGRGVAPSGEPADVVLDVL